MSPKHLGLAALVAIGLTLASWYWLDEREAARAEEAQARAKAEAAQRNAGLNTGLADLFRPLPASGAQAQGAGSNGQQVWLAAGQDGSQSPVPGMPPPDIQPETPQQRAEAEALRKLGYHIDQRYYQMSLADLRQAANGGDRQALTHLAERYLFALDGKPQDPEHEPGYPYREAAREALRQAYVRGNLHAAAIISESYLLEKRPLDAAAWNLVARRAGDTLSADWFVGTKDYQQLNESQRSEANRMAESLWADLEARRQAKG